MKALAAALLLLAAPAAARESSDGGLFYSPPPGWNDAPTGGGATVLAMEQGVSRFQVDHVEGDPGGPEIARRIEADAARLRKKRLRVEPVARFEISGGGVGYYTSYPKGGTGVFFGYFHTGSRTYSFLHENTVHQTFATLLASIQPKDVNAGQAVDYRGAPTQTHLIGGLEGAFPAPEGFTYKPSPGVLAVDGPSFALSLSKTPLDVLGLKHQGDAAITAFLNGDEQKLFDPGSCPGGQEFKVSAAAGGTWRLRFFKCPGQRRAFGLGVFQSGAAADFALTAKAPDRANLQHLSAWANAAKFSRGEAAGPAPSALATAGDAAPRAQSLMLPEESGGDSILPSILFLICLAGVVAGTFWAVRRFRSG